MFQGVVRPLTSLVECQRACLAERNCLGVDWNKLVTVAAGDSQRCYFVYPESTRYGVQPANDECCDHYRRTYCLSTSVPRPSGYNVTTPKPPALPQSQYDSAAAAASAFVQAPPPQTREILTFSFLPQCLDCRNKILIHLFPPFSHLFHFPSSVLKFVLLLDSLVLNS